MLIHPSRLHLVQWSEELIYIADFDLKRLRRKEEKGAPHVRSALAAAAEEDAQCDRRAACFSVRNKQRRK